MRKLLFTLVLSLVALGATAQIQLVNIGASPNDGTGDPLRTAFGKTNANDTYLDGRADDAVDSIAAHRTNLNYLMDSIAIHRLAIDDLNDSILAHRLALDDLTDSIYKHTDTLQVHQDQIAALNDSISVHRTGLDSHTDSIAVHRAILDALNLANDSTWVLITVDSITALNDTLFIIEDAHIKAKLDVYDLMTVGADGPDRTIRSDNVNKQGAILFPSYDLDEEPVLGVLFSAVGTSENYVRIGGGNALYNAATIIQFRAAENINTLTGDLVMQLESDGVHVDSISEIILSDNGVYIEGAHVEDSIITAKFFVPIYLDTIDMNEYYSADYSFAGQSAYDRTFGTSTILQNSYNKNSVFEYVQDTLYMPDVNRTTLREEFNTHLWGNAIAGAGIPGHIRNGFYIHDFDSPGDVHPYAFGTLLYPYPGDTIDVDQIRSMWIQMQGNDVRGGDRIKAVDATVLGLYASMDGIVALDSMVMLSIIGYDAGFDPDSIVSYYGIVHQDAQGNGIRGRDKTYFLYSEYGDNYLSDDLILPDIPETKTAKALYYDPATDLVSYGDTTTGGAGTGVSFGSQYEIPYTNATTDDFDYGSAFNFDGNDLNILNNGGVNAYGFESTFGGDHTTWAARTDATTKSGVIGFPHYNTTEENVLGMAFLNVSTDNVIYIGGGLSSHNAANYIRFNTANNFNTTSGTLTAEIDPGGINLYNAAGLDQYGVNLKIGSDNPSFTTRSDNITKVGRFILPHYDIDEEDFAMVLGTSGATTNTVTIGGGVGGYNSATHIFFNASADPTTLTGTEIARINSDGFHTDSISELPTSSDGVYIEGIHLEDYNLTLPNAGGLDQYGEKILLGSTFGGGYLARTDATGKAGIVATPHYTNAEEPLSLISGVNLSTANRLYLGGGNSSYNTATEIDFFTAPNTTTTTGNITAKLTESGFEIDSIFERTTNNGIGIESVHLEDGSITLWDTDDRLFFGGTTTSISRSGFGYLYLTANNNLGITVLSDGIEFGDNNTLYPYETKDSDIGTSSLFFNDAYLNSTYIGDASTRVFLDGSNNLSFTDAVTGTKTLAQLASGGSSPWSVASNIITPTTGGDDVRLGTTEQLQFVDANSYIYGNTANSIYVYVNSGAKWHFGASANTTYQDLLPQNSTFDLGSSSQKFAEVHATQVLSNNIKNTMLSASLTDGAPTDAEIDSATGSTPAGVGAGWEVKILDTDGTGLIYLIISDGSSWQYVALTKAT